MNENQRLLALKILVGAVIAIVPATLSFCQARTEIQAKYAASNMQAEAGYQALVESVKELQTIVKEQHEEIIRLQAETGVFGKLLHPPTGDVSSVPPQFEPLPSNLTAATLQQQAM